MKKRIAVIVPGGVGGGNFNQGIPALVNLLVGLGDHFSITVFSMIPVVADFTLKNIAIKSLQVNGKGAFWRVKTMARLVMAEHRQHPFDLFHGVWGIPSGTLAVFLGKWQKRPSLVSLQGGETALVPSIKYGLLQSTIKKQLLFWTLRAATRVTVLTHFQKDQLRQHGFGDKPVWVIPYGVDKDYFSAENKTYEGPFGFIHIGNLTEVKDQKTLLAAFKIIRSKVEARLKIIGADYLEGEIQQYAEQLELQGDVTFMGAVLNEEVPNHLAESHVMLHTSLYEAQGVVVVEAMAGKVLVAGTNVGIVADLPDLTVNVPVGDHQLLASRVLQQLADPRALEGKVNKAYEWACAHRLDYTVNEFITTYNELTA